MNIKHLKIKHYQQIISKLILLKNNQDPNIQLKIIQTTLNLINPNLIQLHNNYQFILKIYTICFYISNGKQIMTQKISISALLQITQIIFHQNKFQYYDTNAAKQAFSLLNDLLNYVLLQKKQNINWIPSGMIGIVWDLIMEILKYQGYRISKIPQLVQKFKKLLDFSVKKSFQKVIVHKHDFIRFFRVFCYVIMHLEIGYEYLQKLKIIIDIQRGFSFSVYVQGLMMIICHKSEQYTMKSKQYMILYQLLVRVSQQLCISNENLRINNNQKIKYYLQNATIIINFQQDFSDSILFRILINGLYTLRNNYDVIVNNYNQDQHSSLKKDLQKMVPLLIRAYKYLIAIEVDQDLTRKLIQQFQNWFIICSKLKLPKPKNKLLEELSSFTFKIQKKFFILKCAQAIQIMFNLIYGFQQYLDASSLSIMLKCFKNIQQKYNKQKNQKQWDLEIGFQLQPKINMINSLYDKNTIHLNQTSLKNTIQALNEITLNILQQLSQVANPDIFSLKLKTFGVRKMKVVIQNNYSKLSVVWNFIVAHFLSLCSCKYKQIRIYSIQILGQTINNLLVLNCIQNQYLFSIYIQIVKTKYLDVKILVIQKLIKYLTNHGFKISQQNLIQIIKILKITDHPMPTKQKQQYQKLMEYSQQLNQLIIKQCLINIHTIHGVTQIILNFKIISDNKNHQYQGVGLFWLIADHLHNLWTKTKQKTIQQIKQYQDVQKQILLALSNLIIKNEFYEVRQSGLHTLTQIIAKNMRLYNRQSLGYRIQHIYLKLFKDIIGRYKHEKQKTVKQEQNIRQKQWYETCKSIYSNVLKLMKRLKNEQMLQDNYLIEVLKLIEQNLRIDDYFQMFYFESLNFLLEFKKQIIIKSNNDMVKQIQIIIIEQLHKKLNRIDKQQRINRNKIIPLINQILTLYT